MEKKYFTAEEVKQDKVDVEVTYCHTGCTPSIEIDWFTGEIKVKLGWWSSDTDQKVEDAIHFAENLNSAIEDVKKLQKKYENAFIKF